MQLIEIQSVDIEYLNSNKTIEFKTISYIDLNHNNIPEYFRYESKIQFRNCKITSLSLQARGKFEFIDCEIKTCVLQSILPLDSVIFVDCCFNEVICISHNSFSKYNNCKFNVVTLDIGPHPNLHSEFYFCEFRNGIFPKGVNQINYFNLIGCEIQSIDGLASVQFQNDTAIEQCQFNINESPVSFRKLKKSFADLKNDHTSDLFGFYELKSLYIKQPLFDSNNLYQSISDKFIGTIYLLINNFGLNPYRPFNYIMCISFLIFIFDFVNSGFKTLNYHNTFVFFFSPFSFFNKRIQFDCSYNIYLSFLLMLLSGLLWFFLILGIRKRFKLEK